MARRKKSLIVLLLLTRPLWVLGCRRKDPVSERLELTISNYERTGLPRELWQDRHDQVLTGLRKLRGKTLSGPAVLWATRFYKRDARQSVLIIDYADIQPRAAFFRVYVGDEKSMDFVQSQEGNVSEAKYAGPRVLYTSAFYFERADPPPFWASENVLVEIHNETGEISARFPVGSIIAAGGQDHGTQPS